MLFENNPLSVVCSLVCDHDHQCEGNCIQGRKGMPVQISSIENYISDAYLDKLVLTREEAKHQKAAIIGGGPAGRFSAPTRLLSQRESKSLRDLAIQMNLNRKPLSLIRSP